MKNEIRKSIINKYFICVCIYGIIIAILHTYSKITEYNITAETFAQYNSSANINYNPYAPITNAFTLWIGLDSENKYAKILYLILPIIAVIPYCWSYCNDLKIGYADKAFNEFGKYNYHLSKYTAVFISSGLTIVTPLIIDFLIILLFVPAIFPDSVYDIYYGIFSNNFMADIFYGQPFLYVIIFLMISFVFCGLFGCLGYTVSTVINSRILAVATPVGILFLVEYIKSLISEKMPLFDTEFSPLSFLCPAKSYNTNWIIIVSEFAVLFLFTFYFSVIRFKKVENRK
jgi:hypothetical protein